LGAIDEDLYVAGWALVLACVLACMYFAPPDIDPWTGLLIGAAYAVACLLIGGVCLSCVIHMGIAHRELDYQEWFVKSITVVNNRLPRSIQRKGSTAK
jgi:predicted membrane protein